MLGALPGLGPHAAIRGLERVRRVPHSVHAHGSSPSGRHAQVIPRRSIRRLIVRARDDLADDAVLVAMAPRDAQPGHTAGPAGHKPAGIVMVSHIASPLTCTSGPD